MAVSTERRLGAEDSATRAALLDAAGRLMLEEGYAAVTSRKVAAEAGLKPQLVHYYFRTMDDLYVEIFRAGAEHNLQHLDAVLASPQPLWALWRFSNDPGGTGLTVEFAALANHRKAIRTEIAEYAERFRRRQTEALEAILTGYDIDPEEYPPVVVTVLMTALSRIPAMEQRLGMDEGHAETRAFVERLLTRLEGDPRV